MTQTSFLYLVALGIIGGVLITAVNMLYQGYKHYIVSQRGEVNLMEEKFPDYHLWELGDKITFRTKGSHGYDAKEAGKLQIFDRNGVWLVHPRMEENRIIAGILKEDPPLIHDQIKFIPASKIIENLNIKDRLLSKKAKDMLEKSYSYHNFMLEKKKQLKLMETRDEERYD